MLTLQNYRDQILSAAYDTKASDNDAISFIEAITHNYFINFPRIGIPSTTMALAFARCSEIKHPEGLFKNVKRCSYNPNPDWIELQRCNFKGQQVFYAASPVMSPHASAMSTAIQEVLLQSIEDEKKPFLRFTLSRWKILKPLQLLVFPFSPQIEQRNPLLFKVSKEFERLIMQKSVTNTDAFNQQCLESYKFMSELLSRLEDKKQTYRITSAFYNVMMSLGGLNGSEIDGMFYPSANTEQAGINVALKKEKVDNRFLEVDFVSTYGMLRNTADSKSLWSSKLHNDAIIDNNGDLDWQFNKIVWDEDSNELFEYFKPKLKT